MTPRTSAKRQRIRSACLPCRQRKRKCDGGFPCGMCSTYGYKCQYGPDNGRAAVYAENPADQCEPNRCSNERKEASPTGIAKRGILDPKKSRYMSLDSAVAFPRVLALALHSTNPPHLHSFAWNCGVRLEEKAATHTNLSDFVTQEECSRLANVYFKVVHPVFAVVDRKQIEEGIPHYWTSNTVSAFGAVIAGIIALGSLFSGDSSHPRELDVVQYAKGILEDPKFSRLPSNELVSAWVLRTVYLRATTRPHVAWLASCMTIHLAEATGLHHECDQVELTTNSPYEPAKSESIRRLFWTAWCINTILSYDYGRSSVVLNTEITCKPVSSTADNYTSQLAILAQLVPRDSSDADTSVQVSHLLETINALQELPEVHSFLSLTKADIALSCYRRLRLLNHVIDKKVVQQIIDVGETALSAALTLVQQNQFWWNALSAPFQYVCALMAMDTRESLACVAKAKNRLHKITSALGTHIGREAETTVDLLLQDSIKKKQHEVSLLGSATPDGPVADTIDLPDIDWNAMLDPTYTYDYVHRDFSAL
ncbi:LAME_0H17172g1_1 [Lachancea meyersii CBS 8951]|uniref:LAME_0H17172g1_1 n=1 Tax=Lachancea meyersii CBS 8951 TaxID=1266667 RepID=A0A1G4KI87_9SACH|nr:LAME_0H17172g1_1 [Lachancea meyersii CBS 8951]